MKKFIILSALILTLNGCAEQKETLTYINTDLGIEFSYPEKFGPAQETKNEEGQLTRVGFEGVAESGGTFELGPVERSYVIPNCRETIYNDPEKEKCEILTINSHSILSYEGIGQFDQAKWFQIQTKDGIWRMVTANENLYYDLDEIIKKIKFFD